MSGHRPWSELDPLHHPGAPPADRRHQGPHARGGTPRRGRATGVGLGFSLSEYIEGIGAGWPEGDIARMIVHGLPRGFHARSAADQREALAERVPLMHTKWGRADRRDGGARGVAARA